GPEVQSARLDAWINVLKLPDMAFDKAGELAHDRQIATGLENRRVFEAIAAGQKAPLVAVTGQRSGTFVQRLRQHFDAGLCFAWSGVDDVSTPANRLPDIVVA